MKKHIKKRCRKSALLLFGMLLTPSFAFAVGDEVTSQGDAPQTEVDDATYPPGERFQDCDVCPLMVVVPAGSFLMGAPESEPFSLDSERPQRRVSVPAFAAGVYEVTFAEWNACFRESEYACGTFQPNDFGWGTGDRPVIDVAWREAQGYLGWLSSKTGREYRLLTEAEWEYAARAGSTTPFHTGETIAPRQANYDERYSYPARERIGDEYRKQTMPVGSFAPNAFGLHDMHGNVWEWVQDCWHEDYRGAPSDGSARESERCRWRVLRGGSWFNWPDALRSAARNGHWTQADESYLGFRVARTLTP